MRLRNPANTKWHGTLTANLVPPDVIGRMSAGMDDEGDFNILMNFFCFHWPGRSGGKQCRISAHQDNVDALNVFRVTGPNAKQTDIEVAMKMLGVEDFRDCWKRVMFINSEFGKIRMAKGVR